MNRSETQCQKPCRTPEDRAAWIREELGKAGKPEAHPALHPDRHKNMTPGLARVIARLLNGGDRR